ncbi:MAG: acyltransferase family protein [Spirochaetia bacterium]|nr:acyltransferase family protein [Spirochaetia bacterium]
MNIKKERIDYLDIAKAFAIFLVMMGHTGSPDTMFLYRRIIYSFHMPLFFMISGIVSEFHPKGYSKEDWKEFLKKNAYALIIPYFFWAILYSKFSYTGVVQIIYGSWKTINDSGSVLALWYLVCLFVVRIEMEGVLSIARKVKIDSHLFAALFSPIPFTIGILLPNLKTGYPWQLDVSLVALGFLLLGYASKPLLKAFFRKGILFHLFFFAISMALFASGILYKGDDLELMMLLKLKLGNLFWFFYLALTGSAVLISFSMLIAKPFNEKSKPKWYNGIIWIGRNTLGILVLHKPLLPEVIVPALIKIGMDEASIITSITGSLITLLYTVIGIILIRKYIPVLLGLHPSGYAQPKHS